MVSMGRVASCSRVADTDQHETDDHAIGPLGAPVYVYSVLCRYCAPSFGFNTPPQCTPQGRHIESWRTMVHSRESWTSC